jgi:hypothetical protein
MSRKSQFSAAGAAGIACWLLLAVSAGLTAFYLSGRGGTLVRGPDLQGWVLLFLGFSGVVWMFGGALGWGAVGWCANPCFFVATVALMFRQYRLAIPTGAAAVAFALTSFQLQEIRCGDMAPSGKIVGYGPGFYLWLSAMGLSLAAPACLSYLSHGAGSGTGESQWPTEDEFGKEGMQDS